MIEYVVNKDGKVIGKCFYHIDTKDTDSRQERVVQSDLNIPLYEAKFIGGKIVHSPDIIVKTDEEIEEEMINHEIYEMARRKLTDEGKLKIKTKEVKPKDK